MRLFLSILLLCCCTLVTAQEGDVEYRLELGGGVGWVNYLGDFNGSVLKCLQPTGSVIVRRVINPYMALRADVGYGILSGKITPMPVQGGEGEGMQWTIPEEKFKNSMAHLTATYEYNFWPYGTGRDYHRAKRITPYLLIGLGLTYAKTQTGSVVTGHLPIGAGVKFKVADRLNLGVEWVANFTLSDKLDGYADPYGIPSSGIFKNTDGYTMLKATLTYSLMPKCSNCNVEY